MNIEPFKYPNRVKDLTFIRFSRLFAIRPVGVKNKCTYWLFRCDCGVVKEIISSHVIKKNIVSCGCYLREVTLNKAHLLAKYAGEGSRTHGMSHMPIYQVWKAMRQRCCNPKDRDYSYYGAKGVKVCDRWQKFLNFYSDMGDANGLTLDRINVYGNYEPSNCRWATWKEQQNNKRDPNG